jgi:hypothetical protein
MNELGFLTIFFFIMVFWLIFGMLIVYFLKGRK